ncbi:MAG: HAMP domain-containing histidine kinase [Candidatus Wildermuthbacteria bacterium]|nr:HAMP domain-containing histidine kinase [Candidatus Wildermuthbacteria bacterium]
MNESLMDAKQSDEQSQVTEEVEGVQNQDAPVFANFPVFMKLVVILLVLVFIPFLVITLAMTWNYTHAYQEALARANLDGASSQRINQEIQVLQHDLRIRLGFFLLVFGSFVTAGIWTASKFLVRPLSSLLSGIREIAQGKLGTKISIATNDEFALFADSFNRMSRRLELSRRRDRWVSRMKSELLTVAAHQLRTPLSGLKWVLRMILDGEMGTLQQKQAEFLEKGYQTNERMITLVNDLLSVARIEEGRFGYRFEPTNMEYLITSLVHSFKETTDVKTVSIEINAEPNLPEISVDQEKIKLAVGNLLSNAVRYSKPGGVVDISIAREKGSEKSPDLLNVSVQDRGIGIPGAERARIFQRFFRATNAQQTSPDGSGLGLFITFSIPISRERRAKDAAAEHFITGP